MNKIITIILFVLSIILFSRPVISACYCEIQKEVYVYDETAVMGCYCDLNTEKNKPYVISWYNTTGNAKEQDAGTTPDTVNNYFYENYEIPDGVDIGQWEANLTVDSTFQDSQNFNVTNTSLANQMSLLNIDYDDEIELGKTAGGKASLYHDTYGYIDNAECVLQVYSSRRHPITRQTSFSKGKLGKISSVFDTTDWNKNSDSAGDLVNQELTYQIDCVCFSNCTSPTTRGCCIGSETNSLIEEHLYLENEIAFTVTDDLTPLDREDTKNVMFLTVMYFTILFFLGRTWDITIFNKKNLTKPNSIIKVLLMWLGIWALLIPLQFQLMIIRYRYPSDNYITLFETLYTVHSWIAYIISAFMLIFFLNNILLYLGVDIIKVFQKRVNR